MAKAATLFCIFIKETLEKQGFTIQDKDLPRDQAAKILQRLSAEDQQEALCQAIEKMSFYPIDREKPLASCIRYALMSLSFSVVDVTRRYQETFVPLKTSPVFTDTDENVILELLGVPDVIEKLQRIQEDGPLFVKLLILGYTEKEILGNPPYGIPSMLPTWKNTPGAWRPSKDRDKSRAIVEVLRNHV